MEITNIILLAWIISGLLIIGMIYNLWGRYKLSKIIQSVEQAPEYAPDIEGSYIKMSGKISSENNSPLPLTPEEKCAFCHTEIERCWRIFNANAGNIKNKSETIYQDISQESLIISNDQYQVIFTPHQYISALEGFIHNDFHVDQCPGIAKLDEVALEKYENYRIDEKYYFKDTEITLLGCVKNGEILPAEGITPKLLVTTRSIQEILKQFYQEKLKLTISSALFALMILMLLVINPFIPLTIAAIYQIYLYFTVKTV